ncbi:MAG: Mur ligase domain-containing protein [Candidatus Pacebacteria bacterium]|nr:Mur ligase domain-containing protein [Candidatus Paceibacterota bacterium]
MKIHFIGIGGIGMSALARYSLSEDNVVTGSDLVKTEITNELEKEGIAITKSLKNVDLVVYSNAIKDNHPELKKAKDLGVDCIKYAEALGRITKKYFTIAISGTHGKSTTTAMTALTLINNGLDPTVIIGTKLKEFNNSNFRKGKSKYLVIEADEYKEAFLNYNPDIIVLTNIEADHLDYYKNIDNILNAFKKYIKKTDIIIANKDDDNILRLLKSRKFKGFSLKSKDAKIISSVIKVPGDYNVSNALAALEVAKFLKIKKEDAVKSLSKYNGSWRRFEIFRTKDLTIISDYAHHPTAVLKTLIATREKFNNKKITCVFQPHQYHRTYSFFNEFADALKKAPVDKIILSEIYDVKGREDKKSKKSVCSEKIVRSVNDPRVIFIKSFDEIKKYVIKNCKRGSVVVVMGAGNIYNLFLDLTKK